MDSCVPVTNNQIANVPREPVIVNIQYPEPPRSPYTVFIIFFLTVLSAAFLHDFFPKFLQERKLQEAQHSECKYAFNLNRCYDPVHELRTFCAEKQKCMDEAEVALKITTVILKLFGEAMSVLAASISWKALGVIGAIIFATVKVSDMKF